MGLGVGLFDTAVRAKRAAGAGDTTPPGQVTDLWLEPGADDCVLHFTVPGDNGYLGGVPPYYEIRCSQDLDISNETFWNLSQIVDGPWTAVASTHPDFAVGSLTALWYQGFGGMGTLYFAIRFKDAAGNIGPISNRANWSFY
jgi:hypothetical protein